MVGVVDEAVTGCGGGFGGDEEVGCEFEVLDLGDIMVSDAIPHAQSLYPLAIYLI